MPSLRLRAVRWKTPTTARRLRLRDSRVHHRSGANGRFANAMSPARGLVVLAKVFRFSVEEEVDKSEARIKKLMARILLIDDDDSVRAVIVRILTHLAHTVV